MDNKIKKRSKSLSLKLFKEVISSYEWKENLDILEILLKDEQIVPFDLFSDNYCLDYGLSIEKIKYLESKNFDFSKIYKFNSHTRFQFETTMPMWIFFLSQEATQDRMSHKIYKMKSYMEIFKEFVKRGEVLDNKMIDIKTGDTQDCFTYLLNQDNTGSLSIYETLLLDPKVLQKKASNHNVQIAKNILLSLNHISSSYTSNYNVKNSEYQKELMKNFPNIEKMKEYFQEPLKFEKGFSEISWDKNSKFSFELIEFLFKKEFFSETFTKELILERSRRKFVDIANKYHEADLYNHFNLDEEKPISELEKDFPSFLEVFENEYQNFIKSQVIYKEDLLRINNELAIQYWQTIKENLNEIFQENFTNLPSFCKAVGMEIEKKLLYLKAEDVSKINKRVTL